MMSAVSTPEGQCRVCGGSLTGKRRDAKFCSDRCRQANQRDKGNSFRPVSVTVYVDQKMRDLLELDEWDEDNREAIHAEALRVMLAALRRDP